MKKSLGLPVLLLALVPSVALAASTESVALHAPPSMHNAMAMHAMGTAKLKFSAHDVSIHVTVSHLPAASALHEKAYVVWLVNGKTWSHVGKLTFHAGMAGLTSMPMITKFNRIAVYAQPSANGKSPMGVEVLTGNVMHH